MKIIGTGRSLPKNIVTNDDLAKVMDTSDEWIVTRTGISERRLVKEETTTSMSANAALQALRQSNMSVQDIDLIIVATISADANMPSTACQVQDIIGAVNAVAFDLAAACSGFLFALNTAYAYLKSGLYKNALVIGAETLSKIVNWEDRSTCVLFGDGAGAVIATAAEEGMYNMLQYTDGSKGNVLTYKNPPVHNILVQNKLVLEYIAMEGQEVFKFAVTKVPESIQALLEKEYVSTEDIKYFVLHQANKRIIQSVAKRLHVSEEKFPINMNKYGNTSAASIPILLDEMNEQGMLHKGDKIILSGFGGGLSWGVSLLQW
jgi:3-oxoacyl-(acyl-carrier-protein) synthase III